MSSTPVGAKFDGEVSALYARMFEQHMHPNGPWNKMLAATKSALPDGKGKVIDLATGPGEPAGMIARALPHASVVATDVSEDMVDKARARMADLPNVEVAVADMESLRQFEAGSFDVATACYAYMFPEDKVLALRETLRVLKPGGTLIATYWTDLKLFHLFGDVMEAVLGTKAPPPANPMSLARPGLFDELLAEAGFVVPPSTTQDAYPFNVGTDPDFQYKLTTMLAKEKLDQLDGHAAAREALFRRLPEYSYTKDGDTFIGPNTYALAVATAPME